MKCILALLVLVSLLSNPLSAVEAPRSLPPAKVLLPSVANSGRATKHGLEKLQLALQAKGFQVENAATTNSAAGDFTLTIALIPGTAGNPLDAESLRIRKISGAGKPALQITGGGDRGLMYALLDVADRVGWSTNASDPFSEVRDVDEHADVSDRALSIYTMHRATFEERFFDEAYWARYFDMLARDRFNTFVLVFGYENGGYFAPAYPWFFDVDGFPGVKVPNVTREQQERYLGALNRLIEMAHDRGLRFSVGLWDHIYRGGVQSGGMADADPNQPGPDRAWGLDQTNLFAYSRAGLAKFLKVVPGVDGLQFRMHDESGLKPGQEQHEFWKSIFELVKETRPTLPLTLRAKGLPDEIITLGLDLGLNVRVATKYWMEQVGLPFHPTHIVAQNQLDRRHGYADLLHYPKRYPMHWRLWSAGTMRILLWGDPEFARRFAESTHLYDGDGFEVTEPLGTKMQSQPHGEKPFELLNAPYRYYDYEFERYWHFFQVFGRMAYNPHTPVETWQRDFESRFGPEAAPHVEQALHRASWILPRINASVFPYRNFPTTRGWAEKQRWGDLAEYARTAEGSDTQQFQGIDEAARNLIEGTPSAKMSPQENAAWFAAVSRDVLKEANQAEQRIGAHRNKEFASTLVDLRILGELAAYHSHRIDAGFNYALFTRSQDLNALNQAIAAERLAVDAWEALVKVAGDVYTDNLMMGRRTMDLCGHWRDELVALRKDLAAIEEQRRQFKPIIGGGPAIAQVPIRNTSPDNDLIIHATVSGPDPIKSATLTWRAGSNRPVEIPMESTAPLIYQATVPRSQLGTGASYSIVIEDVAGTRVTFPGGGSTNNVAVTVSNDHEPPTLEHTPIAISRPNAPLRITAKVRDPSGVKSVRLLYRGVTQFQDYETLPLVPTAKADEYEAIVPAEKIISKWDFMYLFEVMDNAGNGKIYPDLETETPYVVVKLAR